MKFLNLVIAISILGSFSAKADNVHYSKYKGNHVGEKIVLAKFRYFERFETRITGSFMTSPYLLLTIDKQVAYEVDREAGGHAYGILVKAQNKLNKDIALTKCTKQQFKVITGSLKQYPLSSLLVDPQSLVVSCQQDSSEVF